MMEDTDRFGNAVDGASLGAKCKGRQIDVDGLHYAIRTGQHADSKKPILNNVCFSLHPGALCALMGPSGSGKSTLLDLLADRKLIGEWSGDIHFNGGPRSKWFQRDSAYILQDDLHIPTLTVRETITFSANVRLPEGTNNEMIEERVNLLIDLMGLEHIQHSLVGGHKIRGISGGQMKRLSIAVEIVSLPDCIFLDEPTSGLDSLMALEVMTTVRKLSFQNRTCVSTIHQPSPQVFALFDTLVLISEGRVIYFGPSHAVVGYFKGLGYSSEVGENPAEFVIEVSQGLTTSATHGCMDPQQLEQQYRRSTHAVTAKRHYTRTESEETVPNPNSRLHATTKLTQFRHLFAREALAIIRDVNEVIAHIVKHLIVGLLIGVIFYDQVRVTLPIFDSQGVPDPEVNNISALLFFGLMHTMVSNVESIPHLCTRNLIFRREVSAFAYSVSPYWLAQTLAVIPLQLLGFLAFDVIAFFLCSFPRNAEYFFYFSGMLFMASLSSYYLAMAIAALTSDEKLAFSIFPLCFLFFSTFAGFAIPVDDVAPMWSWAPWISFVRWSFQGLMVNQWDKYSTQADNDGYNTVLEMYGFDGYDKWYSFWIVGLVVVFNVLLAYWAMRPPTNKLRRLTTAELLGKDTELTNPISNPLTQGSDLNESLVSVSTVGLSNSSAEPDSALPTKRPASAKLISEASALTASAGVELLFRDIHYSVGKDSSALHILKGVSGLVKAGQMCALMGSSGAGKSTLLDILADRKTTGAMQGHVLLNNKLRSRDLMRKSSAYVMQDNIFLNCLTVEETMHYSALLRLPQEWSSDQKAQRVDQIMAVLGLGKIADSLVGDEARRGISGGQKKRLAIGIEIIHLPDIIFLDEPTTGLDSSIAYEVMASVQALTAYNRTVLCTIHQPSLRTFHLFNTVMLMADGRLIYSGPIGKAVDYFRTCAFRFLCPEDSNPADFIIEVASGMGMAAKSEPGEANAQQLEVLFENSPLGEELHDSTHTNHSNSLALFVGSAAEEALGSVYSTSTLFQIQVLVHRAVVHKIRNYHQVLAAFGKYMVIALFYGTVFYQLPDGTSSDAYNNRLSIIFFSLLLVLMGHQEDIPAILEERLLFYRERSSSAYHTLSYWLSNLIVTIPLSALNITLYSSVVYHMVGFRPGAGYFLYFVYIMIVTDFIAFMVCQLVSNVSSSTEIAMSLFPVALFLATAFEGFIVFLPQFPDWLSWASYVSYMRFSFQALVMNEFDDNPDLPLESTYIHQLGFGSISLSQCAGYLWIFLGIHTVVSYFLLEKVSFEKR